MRNSGEEEVNVWRNHGRKEAREGEKRSED